MRLFLTTALFLFSSTLFIGYGQVQELDINDMKPLVKEEEKIQNVKQYVFPRFSMGITPSALFNTCSGVQMGADIGLFHGKGNITMEYGYIWVDGYPDENDEEIPDSGFRLKLGYDHMVPEKNYSIGIGYLHRNTKNGNLGNVEVGDNNYQEREYYLERDAKGGYCAVKWHTKLSSHISIRAGFLIGMSSMVISRSETVKISKGYSGWGPVFFSSEPDDKPYQEPGTYSYPLAGLHLHVSYSIF